MPYLIVFLLVVFYFWASDDGENPTEIADTSEQSNDSSPQQETLRNVAPSQETIQATLQRLESENESVLQARYNEGGAYNWVVIVNRATSSGSWKGYARALCNTLYETNILNEENKNRRLNID